MLKEHFEIRNLYKNKGENEIANKVQLELIASEFFLVKGELRGKYQFKDSKWGSQYFKTFGAKTGNPDGEQELVPRETLKSFDTIRDNFLLKEKYSK